MPLVRRYEGGFRTGGVEARPAEPTAKAVGFFCEWSLTDEKSGIRRDFEREVTEVPANKKPKPAKVSVTYPEPWIERRPNGRRHRPIAVVVRRTVRVFEREVTEVPANKKAKTSKVLAVYPDPVQTIEIIGKQKNLYCLLSTTCIFLIFSIFAIFCPFFVIQYTFSTL